MPTYQIPRRSEQKKRERLVHGRVRLATLLASGLLLLATAVLLLGHLAHHPV